MATRAPFEIGEIVDIEGKTCIINGKSNQLGFHQYHVVDMDTGHQFVSHAYKIQRSQSISNAVLGPLMDLLQEEQEVEKSVVTAPEQAESTPAPSKTNERWAELTPAEIDELAQNRHSKSTAQQTNWAVKQFRRKFPSLLPDPCFEGY